MQQYLPETINVLGTEVKIKIEDMPDAFAEWDLGNCQIRFCPDIKPDYLKPTVLHELIHVIDDFLGIGIKHSTVYAISAALFQVFKANPELARWLLTEQ